MGTCVTSCRLFEIKRKSTRLLPVTLELRGGWGERTGFLLCGRFFPHVWAKPCPLLSPRSASQSQGQPQAPEAGVGLNSAAFQPGRARAVQVSGAQGSCRGQWGGGSHVPSPERPVPCDRGKQPKTLPSHLLIPGPNTGGLSGTRSELGPKSSDQRIQWDPPLLSGKGPRKAIFTKLPPSSPDR